MNQFSATPQLVTAGVLTVMEMRSMELVSEELVTAGVQVCKEYHANNLLLFSLLAREHEGQTERVLVWL